MLYSQPTSSQEVVEAPKKVVKKKNTAGSDGAMDTVEGDDNIIYFYMVIIKLVC